MGDPYWLLSATAQSAAALVAIIGGLVASRLIGLASEREGLRHRLQLLCDEEGSHQERYREVRAGLVAEGAEIQYEHWAEALVRTGGAVTDEQLLEDHDGGGWPQDDLQPHLGWVRTTVEEAQARIESFYDSGGTGATLTTLESQAGWDLEPHEKTIYEIVFRARRERQAEPLRDLGISPPDVSGIMEQLTPTVFTPRELLAADRQDRNQRFRAWRKLRAKHELPDRK